MLCDGSPLLCLKPIILSFGESSCTLIHRTWYQSDLLLFASIPSTSKEDFFVAMHRVVDIMESVTTVDNLEDYLRRLNEEKISNSQSSSCKVLIPINKNKCISCSKFIYNEKVKEAKKKKCTIPKKIKIKQLYMRKRKEQLESIVVNIKKELIDS
ncbi:uncharacterized protein [Leptinotarsa decemlineata]|uniref:uncharacterized protein n=1 Tax=Leptinotarsa decemlineata TaxID=7539 RepID=UPI003D307D63